MARLFLNVYSESNIKMVRTAVTLEVWNAVNSTFHDIEKFSEKNTPQEICQDNRFC